MCSALFLSSLLGSCGAFAQGLPERIPAHVLASVPIEVIRGDRLLQQGRPLAALEQYKVAIDREGTNSDLEVRSATARFALNRCEEGLSQALPHRAEPVWSAKTSAWAAACFARAGDYGEAVYWQEEAVQLDPSAAERWAMLGVYATRLGDPLLAEQALGEARNLDPDLPALTTIAGVFALDAGDIETVLDTFEALEFGRDRPHAMARYLYSWVLMDLGLPEQAAVIARSGLAINLNSPALNRATAEAERRSGNPILARAVIDRTGNQLRVGSELAGVSVRTWADLGELDRAREELDAALPHRGFDKDLVAAAWYLALVTKDPQAQEHWAWRWGLLSESSLRRLDQQVPTGGLP